MPMRRTLISVQQDAGGILDSFSGWKASQVEKIGRCVELFVKASHCRSFVGNLVIREKKQTK